MRLIIFSDVHANIEALETFYNFAKKELSPDYFIFLGDVVGYGPNPKECLAFVKEISFMSVLGNHDYAMINKEEASFFNEIAKQTALWTLNKLSNDDITYLESLPLVAVFDNRYFVHSSPKSPASWHYILSIKDAKDIFDMIMHNIIFVGHTHYPIYFRSHDNEVKAFEITEQEKIIIDRKGKYIFNVGSIGQSRDGDNRLSFVLFDTEQNYIMYYRLEYNYEKTMEKIRKENLPETLALRLKRGR